MRVSDLFLLETPLPDDWDKKKLKYNPRDFKSMVEYVSQRAAKIRKGSSRVAFLIEYQGRPTVLKIAHNEVGIAQNRAEIDILTKGKDSGFVIPIIDYDVENKKNPTWIHMEYGEPIKNGEMIEVCGVPYFSEIVQYVLEYDKPAKRKLLEYKWYKHYGKENADKAIESAERLYHFVKDHDIYFEELSQPGCEVNLARYKGKMVYIDVGATKGIIKEFYRV